ncbi:MAG: regulator of sigma D [Parasphingorhabdus sp.]|jgi:regulator of sigma D|tara:strand:+ start:1629 stop:2108 length:480 start_codon:yes stop_codon:yes gene_type:complete
MEGGMSTDGQTLEQHWGNVTEILDRWLIERRELLVKYGELGEIKTFDGANVSHGSKLQAFCQLLVDYVSTGHFEIFEQLAGEGKAFSDRDGLKEGADLMEKIQPSTELILDFNDKYLATDDLEAVSQDLSNIGEALAQRFESEDTMIAVLHDAHLEQLI